MIKNNEMIYIKEAVKEIIDAIHSVIQVDVTVIDNEYNRIAATGQYVDQIGLKVAENSVFYNALKTGQDFIVETPREDKVCLDCKNLDTCQEFAEVCCPIFIGTEVIGIIGLVAFDDFQRNEILNNKLNLLEFLRKMAELISSKILENRNKEILISQSKQIEVLFDYIDFAVISLSKDGRIIRFNNKAKDFFNLKQGMTLCEFDFQLCELDLLSKTNYSGTIDQMINSRLQRYSYNTKPIIIDGQVEKIVMTISKEQDLIDVMNDIVNIRQVITFDDIIGESELSLSLKESAKKSSLSSSTVLIQGESGTGKELFARAIHNESKRRNMPFVAVNCAAIPENLIESELFGYEEGAFTGAIKGGKPGKFEIADKGTIFLDEIGDMPIHLQTKLLRVLQEREVERIGGKYVTSIDVKVIAATHQNLEELVDNKGFREDLYYRLNVIPLTLIPLREKTEDISLLANFFLRRYNDKLNKKIRGYDFAVISIFESYHWKGNIREMENTIEYAVNMCKSELITLENIPSRILECTEKKESLGSIKTLRELEIIEITKALKRFSRDKEGIKMITDNLGISRATLYRKIKEYKL